MSKRRQRALRKGFREAFGRSPLKASQGHKSEWRRLKKDWCAYVTNGGVDGD